MEDLSLNHPLDQGELAKPAGNLIAFEFTLSFENGEVVDSNVGGEPMMFQSGAGEMLPALEATLVQMEIGEQRSLVLSPEQAYGPYSEANWRAFPLTAIPEAARQIGRKVVSRAPDGSEETVEVVDIRGDKILLDFNHPLAGKTLCFEIQVLVNQPLTGSVPANQAHTQ